jgi:hypothetical protein
MDFCLALFMNLYHLRDWIQATKPELQPLIATYVRESRDLRLARDLCNGSKHLSLNRASVDPRFLTAMEYQPPSLSGEPTPSYRLLMLTDSEKVELPALADRCIDSWRAFMTAHGLHVPES